MNSWKMHLIPAIAGLVVGALASVASYELYAIPATKAEWTKQEAVNLERADAIATARAQAHARLGAEPDLQGLNALIRVYQITTNELNMGLGSPSQSEFFSVGILPADLH